ncbi:oligodendrocyte-myelin glycoprotein-like [Thalassophryne amazonica]|uniref:oligodendrocyte-myelin glycoprotein-like n=1 Tax=Thalassophryne amazonica TaxID=390379 RepID=UPI0014723695|nr:oligodendrocyte-myelin glycoprotein-like [Thalassophryne amazonica]
MRSWHMLISVSLYEALLQLLVMLSLGLRVLAVCPSMCSCSRSHREVDCSWRALRELPDGLQHNLRSLNLSHNRFHSLDGQLTAYTHLRVLDLSHNRLDHLPMRLPRSLWQLYAASNRIHMLDKNDTVNQWNLQRLDLSHNKIERAVFINNTMTNLRMINLSHNHFWTLPTNMPMHLETIDLSHNLLVKVLPGSLDRLPRLTHFFLHANRFSTLPFGVLDKITALRLITLGNNPWSCHLPNALAYLISWTQHTTTFVLGCPCHTQAICGGVNPGRKKDEHFASYNLPPLTASAEDQSSVPAQVTATWWWYRSFSTQLSTRLHQPFTATPIGFSTPSPGTVGLHLTTKYLSATNIHPNSHFIFGQEKISPMNRLGNTDAMSEASSISNTSIPVDTGMATDQFFMTQNPSLHTKKTTTLRTRSVRRPNQSLASGINKADIASAPCSSFIQNLILSFILHQHVF